MINQMYIDNGSIEHVKKGKLHLAYPKDFKTLIKELSLTRKDNKVKLSLAIMSPDNSKMVYYAQDDMIEPINIVNVEEFKGQDILSHIILNLKYAVEKTFGVDICYKYMPKSALVPYGFFKDSYFYICYILYVENGFFEDAVKQNTNIKVDSPSNICDFSNLTFRGRMIIQPLKK